MCAKVRDLGFFPHRTKHRSTENRETYIIFHGILKWLSSSSLNTRIMWSYWQPRALSHSKSATIWFNSFNLQSIHGCYDIGKCMCVYSIALISFLSIISPQQLFYEFHLFCCDECTFLCLFSIENKIIRIYTTILFVHVSMNWFEICPRTVTVSFIFIHWSWCFELMFVRSIRCLCVFRRNIDDDELWNSCRITDLHNSILFSSLQIFHEIYKWFAILFTVFLLIWLMKRKKSSRSLFSWLYNRKHVNL